MKPPLRNIHFQSPVARSEQVVEAETETLPRLRPVTNDPAREFELRNGAVRPFANELASIILFRKEPREVTKKGIIINKRRYWHENSITCRTKVGTEEMVLCVYNRHDDSVIHVLTNDGAYVESIPLFEKAAFFDPASTQKQLSAVKRDQQRVIDRMTEIHCDDALETLQRERENLVQMQRSVSTFDSPVPPDRNTEPTLSRNNPARRIAAAEARMGKAVARDQKQKAKHARTIKRHGAAAARDIFSSEGTVDRADSISTSAAGADLLSVLAGNSDSSLDTQH